MLGPLRGGFFLTHTVHTEITIHSSLLSGTIQGTRQTVRLDNYNTVHQSPATYKLFQCRVLKPTNKLQNIYQNIGWWRGLAVTRWSRSTKLLYARPG